MCFHLKVYYTLSLVFSTLFLLSTASASSSSPALLSSTEQVKLKRSPLEIGYVQFTIPNQHSLHHGVTIHLPSVLLHETNSSSSSEHPHDLHKQHMLTTTHVHYRDEWVPGHVVNHVFIPGKVHHVLVPVVTHPVPVHAVLLHPVHVQTVMPMYRKYYGGFGVGVDYGGRGAGHGYHVL